MKAERRHELRENDLAHALGLARDYLQDNSTKLGLMVVAVVAIAAVVMIATRSASAGRTLNWEKRSALKFDDVEAGKESLATLSSLTSEAEDKSFVLSGLIDQGSEALRLAQKVDVPPDPALNEQAEQAFRSLLTRFPENPLAVGAAHVGLATVAENKFVLDLDLSHEEEARKHLKAVVEDTRLASLPYREIAADRLAMLDKVFTNVRFASPVEPAPEPEPGVETAGSPGAPIEVKKLLPDGTTVDVPVKREPVPPSEPKGEPIELEEFNPEGTKTDTPAERKPPVPKGSGAQDSP